MLANSKLVTNNLEFQLQKAQNFWTKHWKHLQTVVNHLNFKPNNALNLAHMSTVPTTGSICLEKKYQRAPKTILNKTFLTFIFQNKF